MGDIKNILVFGYGNSGRQDDGIAIEMIKQLKTDGIKTFISNVEFYADTQLNIEDALRISKMDIVFFIDASDEDIDNITINRILPSEPKSSFSFHGFSPGFILSLCKKIYNKSPDVFLILIKGFEWEIKEGLTSKARENMNQAIKLLVRLLKNPDEINKRLD